MPARLCILQFINQPSGWLIMPDGIISVYTWLAMSAAILILIFICSKWGGENVSNTQVPSMKRPIADGNNLMSCDSRYINRNVNSQHSSGELLNKITTFKKLLISLWACWFGVVGRFTVMFWWLTGVRINVSIWVHFNDKPLNYLIAFYFVFTQRYCTPLYFYPLI